eukprot:TRINITY_DN29174_c0_g1_i2.p1 TRINITY_DN29174_c0_g1~~TRINITY_DN29174_c0_g1_i2.p1  ORF type:complete len:553 (-),score=49.81 TRINITY_DN29174_c0_g1_i2:98-1756(-)
MTRLLPLVNIFAALLVNPWSARRVARSTFRTDSIGYDIQKNAALLLQSFAKFEDGVPLSDEEDEILETNTAFMRCGITDSTLVALSSQPLQFEHVGVLAKAGAFWRSVDFQYIVKAISRSEMNMLLSWSEKHDQIQANASYESCYQVEESLILPIPLAFWNEHGIPYLLMRNETSHLVTARKPHWRVRAMYDAKPLPNVSPGLARLAADLASDDRLKLQSWSGWLKLKTILQRDVQMLSKIGVVDYSLFVHVLETSHADSRGDDASIKGDKCVYDPSGSLAVCLTIIDYLTKYTVARVIESTVKGGKFFEYHAKLVHAFDCLGNLDEKGCELYQGYDAILSNAGSDAEEDGFVETKAFKMNYECIAQDLKRMRARSRTTTMYGHFPAVVSVPVAVSLGIQDYSGSLYESKLASFLQHAASSPDNMRASSTDSATSIIDAFSSVSKFESRLFPSCIFGLKDFAHPARKDRNSTAIVFSPDSERVFVARRSDKSFTFSKNPQAFQWVVESCPWIILMYHCRPTGGHVLVWDYQHKFGDIEVLMMSPHSEIDAGN